MAWDNNGKGRDPLIVGIGAQKAGTSWLSQMLGQHPQVWATPFKETHFFNHRFIPEHRQWIDWHFRKKPEEIRARYLRRGEIIPPAMEGYITSVSTSPDIYSDKWYRGIFHPAPEGTLPLDVTPEFSTLPEEGVAFAAQMLPETRFVYLIRDPADRAASQLRMNLARERRTPENLDAWMKEVANPVLANRGDYAAYLPRWRKHFGHRLLVLPYGRIKHDPRGLLAEVERHCGLIQWDYANPKVRVFEGPKDIEVPPEAMAALRDRLRPQYDFLSDEFGPYFLDDIR
ncbi:sulfotransferase [Paracoccus suum]|uniref:Sulfotransferase n=2 Tax=Paracoccus suum TaxID=2259340 RepID=A0A344PJU4_9RHOB|nr:sulfotransferase [Paracoccus suum]